MSIIIGTDTDIRKLKSSGGRGYVERDWQSDPLCGGPFARPYDGPRLSGNNDRRDLIADRARRNETNEQRALDCGFRPYNQGSTNLCWANSVVMLIEWHRINTGLDRVPLSSGSLAALVTGYRDIGGWCSKALAAAIRHGVSPVSLWPANSVSKQYDTHGTRETRMQFRPTLYDDLKPKDPGLLIDYLLLNGPVAIAAMWWRHAVMAMDAVLVGKEIGIKCWNSGYGRDRSGFTFLTGNKLLHDEAIGIRGVAA